MTSYFRIDFKTILLIFCIGCSLSGYAQKNTLDQAKLLTKYIGEWYGATAGTNQSIGDHPSIKMVVIPKMQGKTLAVDVYEKRDGTWVNILTELISYDDYSKQIVAYGHNEFGESFIGKGGFITEGHWVMNDTNFKGEPTLQVHFNFIDNSTVALEGYNSKTNNSWNITYIKTN